MALYPSFSKFNVLLGKVQASLGTKQAALINTDLRTVGEDFSLDFVRDFKEQGLAQGIFGQPQKIKSMASVDAKVTLPIIPTGSTTVPNVHDFLRCCGMAYALVGNEHTYSPSSDVETDWKDMTLWGYMGDKAALRSLLTKAHSFMFDLKLSWAIGEAMMAEFTGKGVPDGTPAPGTYPASLGLISTVPPAFLKSTSLNILGGTYCVLKGDVTMGNQIELLKCPSADDGFLRSTIKGRTSVFNITCYQDMGNEDPLAEMDAETLDALALTFGVAGSRISIESSSAQITGCKNGKDGDLNTHEISGYFLNNNWWMPINKA